MYDGNLGEIRLWFELSGVNCKITVLNSKKNVQKLGRSLKMPRWSCLFFQLRTEFALSQPRSQREPGNEVGNSACHIEPVPTD